MDFRAPLRRSTFFSSSLALGLAAVVAGSTLGCSGDKPGEKSNQASSAAATSAAAPTSVATGTALSPTAASVTAPAETSSASSEDTPPGPSGKLPQPVVSAPSPVTPPPAKTVAEAPKTPPAPPVKVPPAKAPPATKAPPAAPKVTTPTPVAPPPSAKIVLDAPEAGSADEVASKVDSIFLPVKRFKARFDQKYSAKIHGTTKKSAGTIYVFKPGRISLMYAAPNKNRAVSDGKLLKIYEHDNQQMFVKQVQNTDYPGAFAFILGKGLRQSFKFKFHKKSKWEGGPTLFGVPRIKNPSYRYVLFYIDDALLAKKDLGAVRRVLVVDAQDNKNRFDFIAAESPDTLADSLFSFEPPPGTQILKN
ncbi:MAG: outer-membrane lipoprotein carrier protein LolA [Myxococcota bacterium]